MYTYKIGKRQHVGTVPVPIINAYIISSGIVMSMELHLKNFTKYYRTSRWL